MARTIVTPQDIASGTPRTPDNFGARLVKYIPAEVITVYLTLDGVIRASSGTSNLTVLKWIIFVLLLAATPFYLYKFANMKKITQVIIATISFAVWVFAVGSGGPFDGVGQRTLYAALILPL